MTSILQVLLELLPLVSRPRLLAYPWNSSRLRISRIKARQQMTTAQLQLLVKRSGPPAQRRDTPTCRWVSRSKRSSCRLQINSGHFKNDNCDILINYSTYRDNHSLKSPLCACNSVESVEFRYQFLVPPAQSIPAVARTA